MDSGTKWSPEPEITSKFWRMVSKKNKKQCWPWLGYKDPSGYGRINMRHPKTRRIVAYGAHRLSLQIKIKTWLPRDIYADHTCMNRICVNPFHLRPVTPAQNATENNRSHWVKNANKTHCKRGHEFTPENTYIPPEWNKGKRQCLKCISIRNAARHKKNYRPLIHAERFEGRPFCGREFKKLSKEWNDVECGRCILLRKYGK